MLSVQPGMHLRGQVVFLALSSVLFIALLYPGVQSSISGIVEYNQTPCPSQCLAQIATIADTLKTHNISSPMSTCGSVYLGVHGGFLAVGSDTISIQSDSSGTTWFRAAASNCLLCVTELRDAGVSTIWPDNSTANFNENFTDSVNVRASLRGGNYIVSLNVSLGDSLEEAFIFQGSLPNDYSAMPNSIISDNHQKLRPGAHQHPELLQGTGGGFLEVKVNWFNPLVFHTSNFVDKYIGGLGRGGQGLYNEQCELFGNLWGSPVSLESFDFPKNDPSLSTSTECSTVSDFMRPGAWKLVNRDEYCNTTSDESIEPKDQGLCFVLDADNRAWIWTPHHCTMKYFTSDELLSRFTQRFDSMLIVGDSLTDEIFYNLRHYTPDIASRIVKGRFLTKLKPNSMPNLNNGSRVLYLSNFHIHHYQFGLPHYHQVAGQIGPQIKYFEANHGSSIIGHNVTATFYPVFYPHVPVNGKRHGRIGPQVGDEYSKVVVKKLRSFHSNSSNPYVLFISLSDWSS